MNIQKVNILFTAITYFFSDSIASLTQNIGSDFNNQLKEGKARFIYFPGVNSNNLFFYIELTLGERHFDTAVIHVGRND